MDTNNPSDFFNTSFDETTGSPGAQTSAKSAALVKKDNYQKLVALKNVNSYSMQQDLINCPRKYQIKKLRAASNPDFEFQNNLDLCFGHAVGAGVAVYDETKSIDKAILAVILAWNMDLFEPPPAWKTKNPKKEFHHAIWAIKCYASFHEEELSFLGEFQHFRTEATFAVDFENGQFYVGHIDELFRSVDGRVLVKENKTTGFANINPAIYANSEQALSYSIACSNLGSIEYDVLYTVYSTSEQRWQYFLFPKGKLAKAEWIQSQYFLQEEVDRYESHGGGNGYFPKRGGACFNFGSECEFFGECDISPNRAYGRKFIDLQAAELKELDEIEHYEFKIKVSDIISELRKRKEENGSN